MEDKIKLIVAVEASVAVNCQLFLENAVSKVKESGVEEKEITEAIEIATRSTNQDLETRL